LWVKVKQNRKALGKKREVKKSAKKFVCNVCAVSCATIGQLNAHFLERHVTVDGGSAKKKKTPPKGPNEYKKTPSPKKNEYECKECFARFASEQLLDYHIGVRHPQLVDMKAEAVVENGHEEMESDFGASSMDEKMERRSPDVKRRAPSATGELMSDGKRVKLATDATPKHGSTGKRPRSRLETPISERNIKTFGQDPVVTEQLMRSATKKLHCVCQTAYDPRK